MPRSFLFFTCSTSPSTTRTTSRTTTLTTTPTTTLTTTIFGGGITCTEKKDNQPSVLIAQNSYKTTCAEQTSALNRVLDKCKVAAKDVACDGDTFSGSVALSGKASGSSNTPLCSEPQTA